MSFNIKGMHYNLVVRLLNDRFGIQVRGGWSCASTYAHYLLDIGYEVSERIINSIEEKNLADKPGWVRLSIHPTMSYTEVHFVIEALKQIVKNNKLWSVDYSYNCVSNEFDPNYQVEKDGRRFNKILTI